MDGMGVGDVCEKGSPGSASSSTTPSEPKEDGHVILIPHSHIFALMLQALKLPPANYHHKTYPGNHSRVTVTFNSSLQLIDGLLVPTSISGVISNNYDEAEDSAAIAAIRFMENACGKEIRDYHYTHVQRLENKVILLERYLDEAKKRIKKVRKGWFYAVRYMSSYSTQIENTTAARRLRGQDNTKGVMKTALASTRKLAKRLRCIGLKSEQCLETTDSIW
ncbi:hypothetical protein ACQJBY_062000 [Aegilops geniculata]